MRQKVNPSLHSLCSTGQARDGCFALCDHPGKHNGVGRSGHIWPMGLAYSRQQYLPLPPNLLTSVTLAPTSLEVRAILFYGQTYA